MSSELIDRLTGQMALVPDEDIQLGRYAIPAAHRDYAFPGGSLAEEPVPIRLVIENVMEIADRIAALLERRAPMSELAQQTPLMTDKDRRLEPRRLDKHLLSDFAHLEKVCRDPDARLQTGHVEVPVGKARRTTWRTVAHLAAHSETWAARRLHGVEPARLLVPIQVPDYEFYENQLVAALVQHLWRDQQDRMEELDSIEDLIDRAQDFLKNANNRPGYRERARLYYLIEKLVSDSSAEDRLLEEMDRASNLSEALTQLLAQKLPRIVQVPYAGPPERRPTNLFLYNDSYRGCARLWDVWSRREQAADTRQSDMASWCRSFAHYTALLIIRAGYQLAGSLDDEPPGSERYGPGGESQRFRYRGRLISLRWAPDDTFMVSADGNPVLRVVPLAQALTRAHDPGAIEDRLRALQIEHPPSFPTAVVYPGELTEREKLPLALRLAVHDCHGRARAGRELPALLPVSPADIDSVGRIARLLRIAIHRLDVNEYPLAVSCDLDIMGLAPADWMVSEPGVLVVLRPPRRGDVDALVSALKSVRGRITHPRQRDLERVRITQLEADLREAGKRIIGLTTCPVCWYAQTKPEFSMELRDNRTYRCVCERCKSSWETRQCANPDCRSYYAVLAAAGLEDQPGGHGDHLDRIFAQDLLASPCWLRSRVYICPHCGKCPESGAVPAPDACERCQVGSQGGARAGASIRSE